MKKKLILITILGIIFSSIIYFYTKTDEITLVSLGDGLSLGMTSYDIKGISFNDYLKEYYQQNHKLKAYYEFSERGKTVKELIYEIKENKTITVKNKDIKIKRAINEASVLTVAIGMDELSEDKITKTIIEDYQKDIEELLRMIKLLNNNKVIVISLYTIKNEELLNISKINAIIKETCIKNDFTFIDISEKIKRENYYALKNNYFVNYLGHKTIFEEIKKELIKN